MSKPKQKQTWPEIIANSKQIPRAEVPPPYLSDSYLYALRSLISRTAYTASRPKPEDFSAEIDIYNTNQIDACWSHSAAVKLATLRQCSIIGGILHPSKSTDMGRRNFLNCVATWYDNSSASGYKSYSVHALGSPTVSSVILNSINSRTRRGKAHADSAKDYKMSGHDYLLGFLIPLKTNAYDIVKSGCIAGVDGIRALTSSRLAFPLKGMRLRSATKKNYYGPHPIVNLIYVHNR